MTPRKFERKKRNTAKRKQRPVILIVAEGTNVTETQYLRSFQSQNHKCSIKTFIAKHVTDPEGMLKAIQHKWEELELDERKGDRAFIVLDLDCSDEKAALIKDLSRRFEKVSFIVSNPCFEIWFLLHYRYSTKQYYSSAEAVKDLKKYIPDYEKTTDIYEQLLPKIGKALKNAEDLRTFFLEQGSDWPSNACNPKTDADLLMKHILL